jgi:hypothetical protein
VGESLHEQQVGSEKPWFQQPDALYPHTRKLERSPVSKKKKKNLSIRSTAAFVGNEKKPQLSLHN